MAIKITISFEYIPPTILKLIQIYVRSSVRADSSEGPEERHEEVRFARPITH